jgi:hypothetical protein
MAEAKPLKVMPQAGQPGPTTGNPIWEMVELTCYVCNKPTYVLNTEDYKPFGDDRTQVHCAFCQGITRISASFHVEPLWKMGW